MRLRCLRELERKWISEQQELIVNEDRESVVIIPEERMRMVRGAKRARRPEYVQSFITNTTAPKSLDELYALTRSDDWCPSMDSLLYMERGEPTGWTVPRWAKIGDVVFFMHSKTSNSHLTAIRTELEHRAAEFSGGDFRWLKFWVNHELDVYRLYGGKIFAVGRVIGNPFRDEDEPSEFSHWGSRVYADIDDVQILKQPVDISEFNDFIHVSRQSAITPVFGKEYEQLMGLVCAKNRIPKRFKGLKCDPMPLSRIDDDNWFDVMQRYRRSFFLEQQFRTYCVDYLLKAFSDRKTLHAESRCRKAGHADTFVDNLVMYRSRWLPVEVKLDIDLEKNLEEQLLQYMGVDDVVVEGEKAIPPDDLWSDRVLVVDTEGVYLYYGGELRYLLLWDDAKTLEKALGMLHGRLGIVCGW